MCAVNKLKKILCFLCVIGVANLVDSEKTEPLVAVKQGQLKGAVLRLFDGSPYYSFKGIPYADIPARFSAPRPPKPWQGVYDATKHGPECTQYEFLSDQLIEGSENCLFLNIYTRSLDKNDKLPVMVFIHGGAYMSGSGDDTQFGGEWIIQHNNVILVTLNYRLEALGFLCLDNREVPGNAGMKDQVAALRWVQNNIEQFGGNPNDVTLFGESSGSASVIYHMISPMSKGLFHKAIAESGVTIDDSAQGKDGKNRAFRVAKYLGNDSKDTNEVLEFLSSVPATKLVNVTTISMTEDEKFRGLPTHFAPVVEKKFHNVEAFLTKEAIDSLITGQITKVPLMIGYNSDEALYMLEYAFGKLNVTNNQPDHMVPRQIYERVSEERTKEFGQRIKHFYVGDRDFHEDDAEIVSNLYSDTHFVYNIHRFAHFYSSLAKTYMYRFSFDTDLNVIKNYSKFNYLPGATHADELFYLFNNDYTKAVYEQQPRLQDIVYRVTKLWTDFAKTGNPIPDKTSGVKWTPYTRSNRAYLDLNEKFTAGTNAEKGSVEFWNGLYCDAGLPCISESNC